MTEKQIMCRWTVVASQIGAVRESAGRIDRVLRRAGGRKIALMLVGLLCFNVQL